MKFFDRLRGHSGELKAMEDRQRLLKGLNHIRALQLALDDLGPVKTPEDEAIASDPRVVDMRHRHPDYQPPTGLTVEDINPEKYLNRPVLMPSYVRIIPAEEQPDAQTETS